MKEQVEIQQFKTSEYWNKDQDISTQVQVSLLNHLHHLGNYIKPWQLQIHKGVDQWYLQKEMEEREILMEKAEYAPTIPSVEVCKEHNVETLIAIGECSQPTREDKVASPMLAIEGAIAIPADFQYRTTKEDHDCYSSTRTCTYIRSWTSSREILD